jgi:hypothetical protein
MVRGRARSLTKRAGVRTARDALVAAVLAHPYQISAAVRKLIDHPDFPDYLEGDLQRRARMGQRLPTYEVIAALGACRGRGSDVPELDVVRGRPAKPVFPWQTEAQPWQWTLLLGDPALLSAADVRHPKRVFTRLRQRGLSFSNLDARRLLDLLWDGRFTLEHHREAGNVENGRRILEHKIETLGVPSDYARRLVHVVERLIAERTN